MSQDKSKTQDAAPGANTGTAQRIVATAKSVATAIRELFTTSRGKQQAVEAHRGNTAWGYIAVYCATVFQSSPDAQAIAAMALGDEADKARRKFTRTANEPVNAEFAGEAEKVRNSAKSLISQVWRLVLHPSPDLRPFREKWGQGIYDTTCTVTAAQEIERKARAIPGIGDATVRFFNSLAKARGVSKLQGQRLAMVRQVIAALRTVETTLATDLPATQTVPGAVPAEPALANAGA